MFVDKLTYRVESDGRITFWNGGSYTTIFSATDEDYAADICNAYNEGYDDALYDVQHFVSKKRGL